MATPFLDNIAGTVAVAPGTGAFTPTAAASGALAWSTAGVNTYTYRADEGANWEIGLGTWNGATLTRVPLSSSNGGALVNFGAGVVVSLTMQADEIQPHIGGQAWLMWLSANNAITTIGSIAPTASGSPNTAAISSNNALFRRKRTSYPSATTANAICGLSTANTAAAPIYSTDAADVGFEITCRFGCGVAIPTGMRALIGLGPSAGLPVAATEPSTLTGIFLGKDSTDANWQIMSRGTIANKIDTGRAVVANRPYEISFMKNPVTGSVRVIFLALDGSADPYVLTLASGTALPANNTQLFPTCHLGLTATITTAATLHFTHLFLRDCG